MIRNITDNVLYVGVNDRTTERFEGLWPLPNGVSYNAYLVKGEVKTAVIDTVLLEEEQAYNSNIEESGITHVDYLIVNHMEPDHSGSIPTLLLKYPNLKIVANRQAINMIKGFYHIDDSNVFHEVKDGDSIDLGGLTLRFYMTPMVHWPETMMTYCPERNLIFSGDAFGTFGALNGGIIDENTDTGLYIEEMYRYYSNIVGKYGKFVLKAMDKLKGLALDYICPTHGPVWHTHIKEVVDIYSSLAAYKAAAGAVIVYGSMYGNTARVADDIATLLSEKGVKNIKVYDASHTHMSLLISEAFRYSALIIASPTYSMNLYPPIEAFLNAMRLREVPEKIFGIVTNYTWAQSIAQKKLISFSEETGWEIAARLEVKQTEDSQTAARLDEFTTTMANLINKPSDD